MEAAGLAAEAAEESDQCCWTLTSVINLMSNQFCILMEEIEI